MHGKYGSQIPKFDRLYCRPTKSPAFRGVSHISMAHAVSYLHAENSYKFCILNSSVEIYRNIYTIYFLYSFLEKLNSIQLTNEISAENYMSEDVHSSTFPRVTDICGNQVTPFLSRSRVFEKLKK